MSNPSELKQTEGRGQKSKGTGSERGHRKGTDHSELNQSAHGKTRNPLAHRPVCCTGYRDAGNPFMNTEEANKPLALWDLRPQDAFGVRFIWGSNNRTSCIQASSQSRAKSRIKYIQIKVVKTNNSYKYYTLFTNLFLLAWLLCVIPVQIPHRP